jgi:hypothetical protein
LRILIDLPVPVPPSVDSLTRTSGSAEDPFQCDIWKLPLGSLSRLEALLRSQDSKVKELILNKRINTSTAGLHPVIREPVIRELGRNTTVTNLAIRKSALSRETIQQLKSMLQRKTALESLDLTSSGLGRNAAAVRSIAEGLRSNTTLQQLGLCYFRLGDRGISVLVNALGSRNASIRELNL